MLTGFKGHVKAVMVDFGYAKYHGGRCYLRFFSLSRQNTGSSKLTRIPDLTIQILRPRKVDSSNPSSSLFGGSASNHGRSPTLAIISIDCTSTPWSSSGEGKVTCVHAMVIALLSASLYITDLSTRFSREDQRGSRRWAWKPCPLCASRPAERRVAF